MEKVLVISGPGSKNIDLYSDIIDNGGDGLVAARHLKMLGFKSSILYMNQPTSTLYKALIKTCTANEIPVNYYSSEKEFNKLMK